MIGTQLLALAQFKAEFKGELSCNGRNLQDGNLNMQWIGDMLHARKDLEDKNSDELNKLNRWFVQSQPIKKFKFGIAEKDNAVGQVTGLAWTEVGGELLTIEASHIAGKGNIIKTGSLGDVMQESIQAALTVVRSRADSLGIKPDFYEKYDVHIHVPEGATPKDGPSAGGGMAISLISAFTGIPVKADTAMTGEITLRGQILKIGGLKEKVLAAHRFGITSLIIPVENEKDIPDIPENIRKGIQFFPVTTMDEVIKHSFNKKIKLKKKSTPKKTKRASKKTSTKQPGLRLN